MTSLHFVTKFVCLALVVIFATVSLQGQTVRTPERMLEEGMAQFAQGNFTGAAETLQEGHDILAARPQPPMGLDRVQYQILLCHVQSKAWDKVSEVAKRYAERYPRGDDADTVFFFSAYALLQTSAFEEALEEFKRFLQTHPRSPLAGEAKLTIAKLLLQENRAPEVVEMLPDWLATLPAHLRQQAEVLLLQARIDSNKLDDALTQALEFDINKIEQPHLPAMAQYVVQLADVLQNENRARDAVRALGRLRSQAEIMAATEKALAEWDAFILRLPSKEGREVLIREFSLAARARAEEQLRAFGENTTFDLARHLRMASCYESLERPHEAAILYEDIISGDEKSELIESAHVRYLSCLGKMESWPGVIKASRRFAEKFPDSKHLSSTRYLEGEAQLKLGSTSEAASMFASVVENFKSSVEAPRSDFLRAYALLLEGDFESAIKSLDAFETEHPGSTMIEEAAYWAGMARFYAKKYPEARTAFAEYLTRYPKGKDAVDVQFRKAQCLFNDRKFAEAIPELETFIREHSGVPLVEEARNMRGDCYLALGRKDEAIAAYQEIPVTAGPAFDYAWFRRGKIMEALSEWEAIQSHFEEFLKVRPNSPRVPEAIGQLAAADQRRGDLEKARQRYWEAIRRYGADPELDSVEPLFTALSRLYGGEDGRASFLDSLKGLAEEAAKENKPSLAARARWMQATLAVRTDPEAARAALLEIGKETRPTQLSVTVLADVADAQRESKLPAEATLSYRTLLSWYPRSLLKDRVYAGLGLLAVQGGKDEEALRWFNQFKQYGANSPLKKQVQMARSEILERKGEPAVAAAGLEELLPGLRGRDVPEVLVRIGDLYMAAGDSKKAIPFYQRVFIAHGRWPELVAVSYWQSGQAFEAIERLEDARRTYVEMIGTPELQDTKEFELATKRLNELGGPPPKGEEA